MAETIYTPPEGWEQMSREELEADRKDWEAQQGIDTTRPPAEITPVKTVEEPAVSPAEWKPDFTKSNPYEGMPPDYITEVAESFVPTPEMPVAPYVGQVISQTEDEATIIKSGGETVTIPIEQLETLQREETRPEIKEDILIKLGVYSEKDLETKELLADNLYKLNSGELIAYDFLMSLKKSNPEGYKILQEKGIDAYNKYYFSVPQIPPDIYQEYLDNVDRYAEFDKPPPIHYWYMDKGYVTAIPYFDPSKAVTYIQPEGLFLKFRNENGHPIVSKVIDLETNQDILPLMGGIYDKKGTLSYDPIKLIESVESGNLKEEFAIALIGEYYTIAKSEYETLMSQYKEDTKIRTDALNELDKLGYRVGENEYNIVGYLRDAIEKDLSTLTIEETPEGRKIWNVDKGEWVDEGDIYLPSQQSITKQLERYRQNYDIALETLHDAGFEDTTIRDAEIRATTAGTIKPDTGQFPEYNRVQEWATKTQLNLERWLLDKESQYKPSEKYAPSDFDAFMGGSLMAVLTMAMGAPMLATQIIKDPTKTPELAVTTVGDMAKHVVRNISTLATTGYVSPYDLAYNTALTLMIVSTLKTPIKAFTGKITTFIMPRGISLGGIAKELSTGRIKPIKGFEKQTVTALNQVLKQAITKDSPFTGNIPIEGTPYMFRYLKTPFNEKIGGAVWHATQEGLDFIKEQGDIFKVGEDGLYTDPWAALNFARSGENPALMLIITDASEIALPKPTMPTITPKPYLKPKAGTLTSGVKLWYEHLEPEAVFSPRTKINIPKPTADFMTRVLAGDYADYFTYDAGRFVPIKIGITKLALKNGAKIPTASDLYAVKLTTIQNAIRDATQALRHPDLMVKDLTRSITSIKDILENIDSSYGVSGGNPTFLGVRDVYTLTNWGLKIQELARKLFEKAKNKTDKQAKRIKIKEGTTEYDALLERNLESVYRANMTSLLKGTKTLAIAYATNPNVKALYEYAYRTRLSQALTATARTSSITNSSRSDALRETERVIMTPESKAITTIETRPITEATRLTTTEEGIKSEVPSSIISPRTAETRAISRAVTEPVETVRSIRTEPTERIYEPTREEPPYTPIIEPPPRFPLIREGKEVSDKIIPSGSITWAQGRLRAGNVWKYIPPPYNIRKPITLFNAPIGARNTDSIVPTETIQIIGSAKGVPKRVSVDLGFADIEVLNGKTISFKSSGEKTNVGTNDPSTTQGLSILDGDFGEVESDMSSIIKSKPIKMKKKRKMSSWDYMTSLKGFRP